MSTLVLKVDGRDRLRLGVVAPVPVQAASIGAGASVYGGSVAGVIQLRSIDGGNAIDAAVSGNVVGISFNGIVRDDSDNRVADIFPASIANLETTPVTINYHQRGYHPAFESGKEVAAWYCRLDHSAGQAVVGIYGEISADQVDTGGAFFKGIHRGGGDWGYVSVFSNGVGLEVASFANGSRNFISTCQTEDGNVLNRDFTYTTLYNAVWGWDGTGGSVTPAAYGMSYMSRSLGHSYRTQLQETTAPGFAWGRAEWGISSFDLSRYHFAVYNHGFFESRSRVADSGNNFNDSAMRLINSYWTGSAAADRAVKVSTAHEGGGSIATIFSSGPVDSEVERVRWDGAGNPTFQGTTLRIAQRRTIANSSDPGNNGDVCFDTGFAYFYVGSQWKRVALSTWP